MQQYTLSPSKTSTTNDLGSNFGGKYSPIKTILESSDTLIGNVLSKQPPYTGDRMEFISKPCSVPVQQFSSILAGAARFYRL